MGPPVGELQLALLIAVAGPKEVLELLSTHGIGEALHVKPDVAVIRGREHGQPLGLLGVGAHFKSWSVVIPCRRDQLHARLIAQASKHRLIQARHALILSA